jgi:hypothetical protein
MPAATDALSESIAPLIGSFARSVHAPFTSLRRPLPSAPTTSTTAPSIGTLEMSASAFASRPITRAPVSRSRSRAFGSDETRQSFACSTAPADARNVAGGADHRAEVLWIFELVERHDDAVVVQLLGEDLDGHESEVRREGDRTLVPRALRGAIELAAGHPRDLSAAALRESRDGVDLRSTFVLDEDTLEPLAVHADRLAHGLEPGDHATHARARPIESAIIRAAARRSFASRMGRPTTTQLAPFAMASSGVATRF